MLQKFNKQNEVVESGVKNLKRFRIKIWVIWKNKVRIKDTSFEWKWDNFLWIGNSEE